MIGGFIKELKKKFKMRKFKNVVEACHSLASLGLLIGASVITVKCTSVNLVTYSLSRVGLAFYSIYTLLYFYSTYEVFTNNRTILQNYYNTKLKHYGELAEKISTTVYVLYCILKVPFEATDRISSTQLIVDIDKAMEDFGENIDYSNLKYLPYIFILFQATITCTRIVSVSLSLLQLPVENLFHMVYFDDNMFIITSSYCFYLYFLYLRYKKLNKILENIHGRRCGELFMFRLRNPDYASHNGILLQNKDIAEKIRKCGEIYDILYKATEVTNSRYGISLWFTLGLCLLYIVLYLYYFMEATALGLFHDPEKYINFLAFVSWQIGYALIIIFLYIYFSERTVEEARKTSHIAHAIINGNLDTAIKSEAVHLSLQVLHQVPVFTGCGLHKLDYELLLEGARSVITFLVIMLQFVTDNHSA